MSAKVIPKSYTPRFKRILINTITQKFCETCCTGYQKMWKAFQQLHNQTPVLTTYKALCNTALYSHPQLNSLFTCHWKINCLFILF